MNLGSGPIDVGQVWVDNLRGCSASLRGSPIHVEKIVAVGPASLGHHLISNENLIRVAGPEADAGLIDRALIDRPARHRVALITCTWQRSAARPASTHDARGARPLGAGVVPIFAGVSAIPSRKARGDADY